MSKTENKSGIHPTEFKVVILPTEVTTEHKFQGSGGKEFVLHKPQETAERDQFAQQDGVIIAVSPLAFTYASKEEWARAGAEPPKAGDKVSFAKFAGLFPLPCDCPPFEAISRCRS